jgi:hypothetical protein
MGHPDLTEKQMPDGEQALTSRDFFDVVVVPNNNAQHADTSDLRHAFNAIAALDAYVGIWAHELNSSGKINLSEEALRDLLADRSVEYRVLRDMAFALKHGELTGKKARLVRRATGLTKQGSAFNRETFAIGFQTEELICVTLENGDSFAVWVSLERAIAAITDLEAEFAAS